MFSRVGTTGSLDFGHFSLTNKGDISPPSGTTVKKTSSVFTKQPAHDFENEKNKLYSKSEPLYTPNSP
jgi:hypothetical protein